MHNKSLASSRDACANNKVSSTSNILMTTGAYRDTLMPWTRPRSCAKDNMKELEK